MSTPTVAFTTALAQQGYEPDGDVWQGMEGTVLGLTGGRVAKSWFERSREGVEQIQAFSADLAAMHLPFGTPEVERVFETDGMVISIERRLAGTPLKEFLTDPTPTSMDAAIEAVLSSLLVLRETAKPEDAHLLPLFDVAKPHPGTAGTTMLGALARRRLEASPVILERIPNAQAVLDALEAWLACSTAPEVLTHGDLCAENVLVDDRGAVTAVLDWGFLTCYAPPVIDLGISTGILDMYSEKARATEDRFVARVLATTDADLGDLLRTRALYALITATAYSPEGTDGHFAWCIDQLQRDDVSAAVDAG